jgi:hypothetical protein
MKYYEVSFEEIQVGRQPKRWKFLVELPEGGTQVDDQSKAMAVAKKAGGAELRTDFNMKGGQAKLVSIDAAKLDSAKSEIVDECRVWTLQKGSEFEATPYLEE